MGEEGLCFECRELLNRRGHGIDPWVHCHHDEPKEKEKCDVCMDGEFPPLYRSRIGGEAITSKFCPECGRKL